MRMRCVVELQYLSALAEAGLFPALSPEESSRLQQGLSSFTDGDFDRIKEIETGINHDVKACEIFLRERLNLANPSMIHFGLTSEDVNNLACSRLLAAFVINEQLPLLERLLRALCDKIAAWRDVAFPARTHGQKASPSTLGKEMAVFVERLLRQYCVLSTVRFRGKFFGATGTGAAWREAFPAFDWLTFSREFMAGMGLEPALATTQVEDHDSWASYFAAVNLVNSIVRDLDIDIWLYQTLGYLVEQPKDAEVGSSTMPHKVNPIRFENSEGNLHVADALLTMMARELTHSRLQRDLSGSTVIRNVGVALAHSHLAWHQTLEGLARLQVRADRCAEDLAASPELLAEPIQTILKTAGATDPYEAMRRLTQGRAVSETDMRGFVESLDVAEPFKSRLRELRLSSYTGYAGEICDRVRAAAREALGPEERS